MMSFGLSETSPFSETEPSKAAADRVKRLEDQFGMVMQQVARLKAEVDWQRVQLSVSSIGLPAPKVPGTESVLSRAGSMYASSTEQKPANWLGAANYSHRCGEHTESASSCATKCCVLSPLPVAMERDLLSLR